MDQTLSPAGARLVGCARRAFGRQRLAAAGLVTLLLSLGTLVSPALLEFFSPLEIAEAWFEVWLELALIAAVLLLVFAALEDLLPRQLPFRSASIGAALLAASAVLALVLHAYYAGGLVHLPPALRILADSLRWGLPAVFLALIAEVQRRALQADSAALAAELARVQMQQAASEQQLALLQAQIEPHFLFNVLGNVRRLYRTRPEAGAGAIDSLMAYLRSALPQLRSRHATLRDEIASVQPYLELFKLRMGEQLSFSVDVDPAVADAQFPPTLLITLVENALKHGLEPLGGGHIAIRARRRRRMLEVSVADDGAGFGNTASSGTGVGLVNIRRQLQARYQGGAIFTLEGRQPHGACARISVPLHDGHGSHAAFEPHGLA